MNEKIDIEHSPVFTLLCKKIEATSGIKLNNEKVNKLIRLVMNEKNMENRDVKEYIKYELYSQINSKEKILITYRKDVLNEIRSLKKSGTNHIVLFTYENIDRNFQNLLNFLSNKINILVVRVNHRKNKELILTNEKNNNHFLINTVQKESSFVIETSQSHYINKYHSWNHIMTIIRNINVIDSKEELNAIKIALNEGMKKIYIQFNDTKGFYFVREIHTIPLHRYLISPSDLHILKEKILVYEKKENKKLNQKKFINAMKNWK